MALPATIHRVELVVSDLDRNVYGTHLLTLARHPSETQERLMMRLLAFALHADERLRFGAGVSTPDEAALQLADDTGAIDLWIEVGLPDERQVRKACGRARRVVVLAYGGRRGDAWWATVSAALARHANLRILVIEERQRAELASLAHRSMALTCTIQDGRAWIADADRTVEVAPEERRPGASP